MTKYLLSFSLLLAALGTLSSQSSSALFSGMRARQIGPAVMSGRISSLDVVNTQPEIMYVGSAGGGIWKSVTGGLTFIPVFDDHLMSIGKLCIDQKKPSTVWAGTGEQWVRNSVSVGKGIYKTTNAGGSWQLMGLEKTERISDIVVHPTHSDTVFVAALGQLWSSNEERGVYRSTDGGKTWERVLYIDENTGASDLDIDPQNPDILYATMWSHRRYPDFFDSGLNGKSGVYKSTDGGKTWKTIHNGLPQEALGRMAIALAPSNPAMLYLSVECKSQDGKGLYLSTDHGESWKKINNSFNTTVRPFYFSHMVVDPKNDSIVMKTGLSLIISEDRGDRFREMDGSVHSDVHAIWINPNNTKHVIIGTDGGVYESVDRGQTFRMYMNLPVSQFYHVSVDDAVPFNVYGGLQDNGSWYGPSRKAGGITNSDWLSTYGGDGFYSFRHPKDPDVIFSEYQEGNLVRYNKKSGIAKDIKPYPAGDENQYRFNWNAPIHLSPTNPDRMYFGSQYLFMSTDRGDSWTRISPDLTTNDPKKQRQKESGGLTIDNSSAENHCTIYAIAESPKDGQIVWVGTDDGNLQVTADGGKTWTNVVANVPGLPKNTWVSYVEPGHFDRGTAYVTFDGHRTGDMTTYLYKTSDLGKTWTRLATEGVETYAHSVREDLVNPNLLFLGTEFGLYVSIDGGAAWSRFDNNLPKVAIYDMVIHPRDHALVLATHGRGVVIIDDLRPLRQVTAEVLAKPFHFFETAPTLLRDPGAGSDWYGGSGNFVGPNPSSAAKIVYYMSKRHTFGKMNVEVYKDGKLLKTLPAGKSAGINIVEMPTSMSKPKAPPTKNRQALFGSIFGPNLEAGEYEVRVIKGKDTYTTTFTLANDPSSVYDVAERKAQRELVMKLYGMVERMAYLYEVYDQIQTQTGALKDKASNKLKKQLEALAAKAEAEKGKIVSLEGDGYVDEDEKLNERISNLYRVVSSFPGKPSDSQARRTALLEKDVMDAENQLKAWLNQDIAAANKALTSAKQATIQYPTYEAFLSKDDAGAGSSSGGGPQSLKELEKMFKGGVSLPGKF